MARARSARLRRVAWAFAALHSQSLPWCGLQCDGSGQPLRCRGACLGALAAEAPADAEACTEVGADGALGSCGARPDGGAASSRPLRWRGLQYSGHNQIYSGKLAGEVFGTAGFEGPVVDDDWDLLFTHWPMGKDVKERKLPRRWSRLHNHCQYFDAAGDKCKLEIHLRKVRRARENAAKRAGSELETAASAAAGSRPRHLLTYHMKDPDQAKQWEAALQADPGKVWLVKPCTAGHSQGIDFVSGRKNAEKAKDIMHSWAVVQEFVDRPYLGFGGNKFHLRLYILVTRWEPVAAYLYNEGIIFRSRHAYNRKKLSSKKDIFSGISKDVEGLPLVALWEHLGPEVGAQVRARVVGAFADVFGPEVALTYGSPEFAERAYGCFDLFGADVMLDESLQPLLLEVNQGPNMWVDGEGPEHEPLLRRIKVPLMEQIARWAALVLRASGPLETAEADRLEAQVLQSFTRVGPVSEDGAVNESQRLLQQEHSPSSSSTSSATSAAPVAADPATDGVLRWRGLPYRGDSGIYAGILAVESFAAAGFQGPVGGHDWDLLFTHYAMGATLKQLTLPRRPGRLVNHCEYFLAAGHKCRLASHLRNVQLARTAAAGADSASASGGRRPRHLRVFEMKKSQQADEWRAAALAEPDRLWLAKPCTAGHSQGIQFLSGRDIEAAKKVEGKWTVVQEYVERPFLGFGGRKFHLRLYVLVTRWDPVGAMLYDEGVIFRSRHAYGKQPSGQRDIFSGISQDVEPLPLAALWAELGAERAEGVRAGLVALFAEVLGPEVVTTYGDPRRLAERGYGCFDLFGADVMLDESLEPVLLEVNQGPNMWVDEHPEFEPLLRRVKGPMMAQLATWAALYARGAPRTADAAEAIERQSLLNFSRVL